MTAGGLVTVAEWRRSLREALATIVRVSGVYGDDYCRKASYAPDPTTPAEILCFCPLYRRATKDDPLPAIAERPWHVIYGRG